MASRSLFIGCVLGIRCGESPGGIGEAFEAFEEAGGAFDPEIAGKLEKHILSAGGSEEADALYMKFRGKMPGVKALLKGRGLLDAA